MIKKLYQHLSDKDREKLNRLTEEYEQEDHVSRDDRGLYLEPEIEKDKTNIHQDRYDRAFSQRQ